MKKPRICYFYKIENVSDVKKLVSSVEKIEGVISCHMENDHLFYELNEWANEYDVLTQSMAICEDLGGELIIGDDNQQSFEDDTVENDNQTAVEEENAEELISNTDNESEPEALNVISYEAEPLAEKRKKLKNDIIVRAVELSLSLILFIVSTYFIKNSSVATVSINTILYVVGFAFAVYEVFYTMFIQLSKKAFYDSSVAIVISLVACVLFGGITQATLIAIIYAVLKSAMGYGLRYRQILLAELNDVLVDDEKKAFEDAVQQEEQIVTKKCKLKKVLGYVAVAISLASFLAFINVLKIYDYVGIIIAVAVVLAVASDNLINEIVANSKIFALYCEIKFLSDSAIDDIAKTNALEIDASVLCDGQNLKEDALGAMKELVLLGTKSLKTNFDVEPNEEVRSQIDFCEKQFKGKNTLTVGGGKMVDFNDGATCAQITGSEAYKIPLCYKIAKRNKKTKNLAKVLKILSLVLIVPIAVVSFIKLAYYGLFISALSVGLLAVAALVGLLNLRKC